MMEQVLKALCVKHGLLMMSVGVWPNREKPFAVYVHPDFEICGFGEGATVDHGIEAAMLDLRTKEAA
jgi:hypothetical protein